MREIKFRAWEEIGKVMHNDFKFIKTGEEGNDWMVFVSDKQPLDSKPHPFENPHFSQQFKVMQFTGCKDFFGTDIYDGDVVFLDSKMMTGKIFNDGISWRIQFEKDLDWLCDYFEDLHVVGNIYENPKLIGD